MTDTGSGNYYTIAGLSGIRGCRDIRERAADARLLRSDEDKEREA